MKIDAIIDTNIIIDLLHKITPAISWHQTQSNLTLAITPINWFETLEGANNNYERDQALKLLRLFHLEYPIYSDYDWAMRQYGQFYLSHGIDWEDCMIAVRLSLPFYIRNTKHFAILPNLDVRQPY